MSVHSEKTATPPDSITIWSVTVTLLHLPFTALLRKMNRFPDAIIHCCKESRRKTQLSKRRKQIRTTVLYKRMCLRKTDSTGTIRRYKVQLWYCKVQRYMQWCSKMANEETRHDEESLTKCTHNWCIALINSKHVPRKEFSQEAQKLHVPESVSLFSDTVQEKKSEQQRPLVART